MPPVAVVHGDVGRGIPDAGAGRSAIVHPIDGHRRCGARRARRVERLARQALAVGFTAHGLVAVRYVSPLPSTCCRAITHAFQCGTREAAQSVTSVIVRGNLLYYKGRTLVIQGSSHVLHHLIFNTCDQPLYYNSWSCITSVTNTCITSVGHVLQQ